MARWKLESKPVIGLAGGIGSGKSYVAGLLRELGCGVIDADALAREALDDPQVRASLTARFGGDIVDSSGAINRKVLAGKVFDKPDALHDLEVIIHPKVHTRRRMLRLAMASDPAVVAVVEDCPLLFEKRLDAECDITIFVDAPRDQRVQRVTQSRGWTDAELAAREKNQWCLDIKAKSAHYVIRNDSGEASTREQVGRVLSMILIP